MKIISSEDPKVLQAIEEAASAACARLDETFPGFDNGGVSSNFQGELVEVITRMLKGQAPQLYNRNGYAVRLPRLIADASLFGNENMEGNAFLPVIKGNMRWSEPGDDAEFPKPVGNEVLALAPGGRRFIPIEQVGDAFTCFQGAARALFALCEREGLTYAQVKEMGLTIKPVEFIPDCDRGFQIEGEPSPQVARKSGGPKL